MSDAKSQSVSQLIEEARRGDADCRDRLFGLCRSYLALVARSQVESWLRVKVDASDLVQETMLEAYRDFARFDGRTEKEWLAWLRRILAHNAADFVRRYRGTAKRQARREVRVPRPQGEARSATAPPSRPRRVPRPARSSSSSTWNSASTATLAQLPPDYQEVIVLRNLQRLPFNEVAERMGRSRPAVQMLWMRSDPQAARGDRGGGVSLSGRPYHHGSFSTGLPNPAVRGMIEVDRPTHRALAFLLSTGRSSKRAATRHFGRPLLLAPWGRSPICLNVSHAAD